MPRLKLFWARAAWNSFCVKRTPKRRPSLYMDAAAHLMSRIGSNFKQLCGAGVLYKAFLCAVQVWKLAQHKISARADREITIHRLTRVNGY